MKNQIIPLDTVGFISVVGPDASKFLQGQLSCNLDQLSPDRSLRGALCNLKGRVIADVRVVQTADGCLLRTSRGLAEVVLKTLSKYAVFSKVKLAVVNDILALGVLGNDAEAVIVPLFPRLPVATDSVVPGDGAWLLRCPGQAPRYELWIQNPETVANIRAQALLTDDDADWRREDLRAGIVHVDSATTEEFTPQLLNYDISGVIDFKKGCYTGQEVVARMFYRGVAKKRLFLVSSDRPIAEQDVVHQAGDGDTKNYPILAYSNSDKNSAEPHLLLAVLDMDVAENVGRLTLGSAADAQLSLLPLDYSVPPGQ